MYQAERKRSTLTQGKEIIYQTSSSLKTKKEGALMLG